MIKVSICIPTFGQPNHLNNLLDSIFHQSYDEYEIIITAEYSKQPYKEMPVGIEC